MRAAWLRAEWLILLTGAALCGACGGETDTGASSEQEQPYNQCEDAAAIDKVLIGEFETPMAMGWSFNGDMSPAPVLSPVAGGNPPTTAIDVERCGPGGSALHVTASNITSYGPSISFNNWPVLDPANTGGYFDASSYTGVSFWVRRGQNSGTTLFASVADRSTDPMAGSLFTGAERDALLPTGNYCGDNAIDVSMPPDNIVDPLQSQCDRFGAGIGLGTEWRFYKVPFNKMRQRAYGRPALDPQPDPRILRIEFGLDGEVWDLWLDDVAFYKEAPAPAQN
jgi:hypothetical protein